MRRTETPKPIWIKFCSVVDIPDIVTYTNFGDHRLRGFWVAGGHISPSPIDFHRRPYNTLALPCERVIHIGTGHTRHDKTVAPACPPPPPRRRPGKQLRLAARPPIHSDVVRHAKCKHAVDCCCISLFSMFICYLVLPLCI